MRHSKRTVFFGVVARVLVPLQVVAAAPVYAAPRAAEAEALEPERASDSGNPDPVLTPKSVTVNRTPPKVQKPPVAVTFSASPMNHEFARARVFSEPLYPVGDEPTTVENKGLATALQSFQRRGLNGDTSAVDEFLNDHPNSPWAASLLVNLGTLHRKTGALSKALVAWQRTWDLAREATDEMGKAIADRALGNLCQLEDEVGHLADLEKLLSQVEGRDVRGTAGEQVHRARRGLAILQQDHAMATPSGPSALGRLFVLGRPTEEMPEVIRSFHATPNGASLTQMADLGKSAGLNLQMAYRNPGAEIPTPSVAHLKLDHFTAILDRAGDSFLLDEPILGGKAWVTRETLLGEASGYFLIPGEALPPGWRAVDSAEGETKRGKCTSPQTDLNGPRSCPDKKSGGNASTPCSSGLCMAVYDVDLLHVSTHVTDTPMFYTPPRGPAVHFRVDYNEHEGTLPQIFSFANVGNRWTFVWQSYVEDNPTDLTASANVHLPGGGQEVHAGFNAGTQSYASDYFSHSVLVRTSTSPIRYERRLPDGSVNVFSTADTGTSPRRVFLTSIVDPHGNALSLTWQFDSVHNSGWQLTAVTDAIGQVTTLSYENPADWLKITKVTDPFGRFATLGYNTYGHLVAITDLIGIVSSFTYDVADFMRTLTTPYGTTSFTMGVFGHVEWLQTVDPLGAKERFEAWYGPNPGSSIDPITPTGVTFNNSVASASSVYWDKRAQMLAPGDYSKAEMTYWLQAPTVVKAMPVISSIKKPLENRLWYSYNGQTSMNLLGSQLEPAAISRVLDNGTTQAYRYEYGPRGLKTRETDPVGRTTIFNYDPGGSDLLEVRQVNGQTTGLLASFTYNSQHRPLSFTDTSGQTTTYTYTAEGRTATITTAARSGITENRTTTFSYDTNGYLQSVTGPATGATTSYTYDGYGRQRTVTDSEGYVLTTDYDALDRPTKATYPDGTYEQTVYNRLDDQDTRDRRGRRLRGGLRPRRLSVPGG